LLDKTAPVGGKLRAAFVTLRGESLDDRQDSSASASAPYTLPSDGKHRSWRGVYRNLYWLRVTLQTGVPAAGTALLLAYAMFKSDLAAGPWSVAAFLGAVAVTMMVPAVSALARHWDEMQRRDWNKTVGRLAREIDAWRDLTRFYTRLNSAMSEFTLDESRACIEPASTGTAITTVNDPSDSHHDMKRSIQRLVALLYRLLLEEYGHTTDGRGLRVAFFEANDAGNSLILRSMFTSRERSPRSVMIDQTNPHLARDGDSLASFAWNRGQMVIVSDTAEECRTRHPRFVPFDRAPHDPIRCIVAYPIVDRGLVEAGRDLTLGVICVDATHPNVFGAGRERSLAYLFDTFAKQLCSTVHRAVGRDKDASSSRFLRQAFAGDGGTAEAHDRHAQTLLRAALATADSLVEHHDREIACLSVVPPNKSDPSMR